MTRDEIIEMVLGVVDDYAEPASMILFAGFMLFIILVSAGAALALIDWFWIRLH